jgi:glutamine synthetase
MVEAGLEGIRNNLKSDEPMSAQDLSEAVHTFDFENTLPKTLKDAVVEMDKDALVKNVLGDVYENYKRAKINEWTDYISIVHDWEVERYISRY